MAKSHYAFIALVVAAVLALVTFVSVPLLLRDLTYLAEWWVRG